MDFFYCFFLLFLSFISESPNTFRLYYALFFFPLSLFFSSRFSMQAQIKILNFMDKKEQTAQALTTKKSTLMELEAQAQKVSGSFFSRFLFFPIPSHSSTCPLFIM